MKTTMNREQIAQAIGAGLELLGPQSNISVPARLVDGVHLLKLLLGGIAQGEVAISAVEAPQAGTVQEVGAEAEGDD